MKVGMLCILVLSTLFVGGLTSQEKAKSSIPEVQNVEVETGISLEVLDWGGTGSKADKMSFIQFA